MITYKISSDVDVVKQLANDCYKHRLYWNMGMLIDYYKRIEKLNKIWNYNAIDFSGKEYNFPSYIIGVCYNQDIPISICLVVRNWILFWTNPKHRKNGYATMLYNTILETYPDITYCYNPGGTIIGNKFLKNKNIQIR